MKRFIFVALALLLVLAICNAAEQGMFISNDGIGEINYNFYAKSSNRLFPLSIPSLWLLYGEIAIPTLN
jgi:hypothetical protein